MRIIYMGTPDFAVPTLEALIQSKHEVIAVITQPDKPKGRGKAMQFPPVKEKALEYGAVDEIITPEGLKDADMQRLDRFFQRRYWICHAMDVSMYMHHCFQNIVEQLRFSG